MLWLIGAAVAVGGATAATVIDIRTREIPNAVTLGMLAIGAVLCLVRIWRGEPWLLIVPPVTLAVGLAWLLWRAGLFGGGDAKLMMAIAALLPLYRDGTSFLPTFFVMLAVAAFIHYFVFGVVALLRQRRVLPGLVFAVLPPVAALGAFVVARRVLPWPHIAALLALALVADLVSPLLPYRRRVKVHDGLKGLLLAETIGLRNGTVVREPVPPSLLRRAVQRPLEMDEVIAAPHHLGLEAEEIARLRGVVDEVAVFPVFPFAPVILAALLLSLSFGTVMPM